VTFKWKDYRAKGDARYKLMTLDADEFTRRFLTHVLPDGFHRIRHYGLLANANRAANIALARRLLGVPDPPPSSGDSDGTENPRQDGRWNACPCCGGRMIIIDTLQPGYQPRLWPLPAIGLDSHDRHTPVAIPHNRFRPTPLSHRHSPCFAESHRQCRLWPAKPAASNAQSPRRSHPERPKPAPRWSLNRRPVRNRHITPSSGGKFPIDRHQRRCELPPAVSSFEAFRTPAFVDPSRQ
jgi:hypothetical protein